MKRDHDPQPGMAAVRSGDCPRCPNPIRVGDRIVYRKGLPVHIACVNGADDE